MIWKFTGWKNGGKQLLIGYKVDVQFSSLFLCNVLESWSCDVAWCSSALLQPHLVSSHRRFIVRCDVIELSDGLSGRGDSLIFFLFSDMLEVHVYFLCFCEWECKFIS
jgi:hypothetical protein